MSKLQKNTPSVLLAVNSNNKSAIKFEKKAICKTEICKKQAQKTSNPQVLKKKPQIHKK